MKIPNYKPAVFKVFLSLLAFTHIAATEKNTWSEPSGKFATVISCTPLQMQYSFTPGQPLSFNFNPEQQCIDIPEPVTIQCAPKLLDSAGNVVAEGYEFTITNPQEGGYQFVVVGDNGDYVFEHFFQLSNDGVQLISKSELDNILYQSIASNGTFSWKDRSNIEMYSALQLHDKTLFVGYKPAGYGNVLDNISLIDVNTSAWVNALQNIKQEIQAVLNDTGNSSSLDSRILFEDNELPFIVIKVEEFEMIERLRSHVNTEFIEPGSYIFGNSNTTSSMQSKTGMRVSGLDNAGCGSATPDVINSEDYTLAEPVKGPKIPWNYNRHNIHRAWMHNQDINGEGGTTGRGITIGLIDTGVSKDQFVLQQNGFSVGESKNRTIEHLVTAMKHDYWKTGKYEKLTSPYDECGHGTQMAGCLAAPMIGSDRTVGVAYGANLVSVRASNNVVFDETHEVLGVVEAYKLFTKRPDVKIISMSMGCLGQPVPLSYAIRKAAEKGKLIFNAGGTSWDTSLIDPIQKVIFPAKMRETIAVSGVNDGYVYEACTECHSGSELDFTIIMQRKADKERRSLSLSMVSDQPNYVGGSSIATATMAGIAALVWSTNPGLNKDQVLDRLKRASFFQPPKNARYGHGNVDALKAVKEN